MTKGFPVFDTTERHGEGAGNREAPKRAGATIRHFT